MPGTPRALYEPMLLLALMALAAPLSLDVNRATALRVDVTVDETRLVIEATGDVDAMTLVLKNANATVEKINSKHVWASLVGDDTLANVRTRGDLIVATTVARTQPMLERLRERLPDFASLAENKAFRLADNAVTRGDYKEAAAALAGVPADAPGYPWAQLRGADIAVLAGQTEAGCTTYVNLARMSLDRTSNVVAGVRARAFTCAGASEVDWAQTLKRARGVDGGTGLWMAYELIAAAEVVREQADIDGLLTAAHAQGAWPQGTRSIVTSLAGRLLVRAANARAKDPIELAAFIRKHSGELTRHADGKTLRLDAARALLDLDLADDALTVTGPLLQHNLPRADAPLRTWRILSDAYASRGDSDSAQKLAKAFEERFHETLDAAVKADKPKQDSLTASLSALERRIARLKEHVGARAPGEANQ